MPMMTPRAVRLLAIALLGGCAISGNKSIEPARGEQGACGSAGAWWVLDQSSDSFGAVCTAYTGSNYEDSPYADVATECPTEDLWTCCVFYGGTESEFVIYGYDSGFLGLDQLAGMCPGGEFQVFELPLKVEFLSPAAGEVLSEEVEVEVQVENTDNLEHVTFYLDGDREERSDESPATWEWDTCTTPNGEHVVEVKATTEGEDEASASITVWVENELEVAILSPSGDVSVRETLEAQVAGGAAPYEVVWSVDGDALPDGVSDEATLWDCDLECGESCQGFEMDAEFADLEAGEHVLRVTVTDAEGTTRTDSVSITLTYDADRDGYESVDFGGDDCDDTDRAAFPGAAEEESTTRCMADADNDGYGDANPAAGVDAGTDCDDGDRAISPVVADVCNALDDDCDGTVDGGTDADGDGIAVCDCDDTDANANPDLSEVCNNGRDDDCSGGDAACSLADAEATFTGAEIGDGAGSAVSVAGDMNADGYDDLVVGVFRNADGGWDAGAACVLWGSATLTSASVGTGVCLVGEADGDHAGAAIAWAGDVDADGLDDLIIGAPESEAGGGNSGVAYLVLGSAEPASSSLSAANAIFIGSAAGDLAGSSVAGGGDVNGDGFDDLVVGAPNMSGGGTESGAAYVIFGSTAPVSLDLADAPAVFLGDYYWDNAGTAVAVAGDVNADGVDDLLVGAPDVSNGVGPSGEAYLVLGSDQLESITLDDADATFAAVSTNDSAGCSVAGVLDVNGDGHADILVGAEDEGSGAESDRGAAYLVLGSSAPSTTLLHSADATYTGELAGDHAGSTVAAAGDVNGDGFADLLIGANDAANSDGADVGAAYVLLGAAGPASRWLAEADGRYFGAAADDVAGASVGGGGDLDGDGYDDVAVGASGNDDAGSDNGTVYLIFGEAGSGALVGDRDGKVVTGTDPPSA